MGQEVFDTIINAIIAFSSALGGSFFGIKWAEKHELIKFKRRNVKNLILLTEELKSYWVFTEYVIKIINDSINSVEREDEHTSDPANIHSVLLSYFENQIEYKEYSEETKTLIARINTFLREKEDIAHISTKLLSDNESLISNGKDLCFFPENSPLKLYINDIHSNDLKNLINSINGTLNLTKKNIYMIYDPSNTNNLIIFFEYIIILHDQINKVFSSKLINKEEDLINKLDYAY